MSRTQLIVLFIITVGVANRSMALPILLEDAERDSQISVLASYGVMLIWVYILYVIMSRNKQKARLFDWMEAKGGRLIKAILCSLFALSIILSTAITFFGLVRFVDIFSCLVQALGQSHCRCCLYVHGQPIAESGPLPT